MQTVLEQVNKLLAEMAAHTADIKGYPIDFKLGTTLVVVKLGFVEGDQLEYHHANGENFCLKLIIIGFVVHLLQRLQLLGTKHVLFNTGSVTQGLVVVRVPVLLVYLKQVQLHVPLRAEVDGRGAVVPVTYSVLHEVAGCLEQAPHDVD